MKPSLKQKIDRLLLHRSAHLENRSTASVVHSLGRLSTTWLDTHNTFRKKALRRLVAVSGYGEKMAARLLDGLFGGLTEKKLFTLLRSEFRDPRVLDDFKIDPITRKKVRAQGPCLITHIFSGNVPNPAVESLVFGMLLKSVNLAKASSRDGGIIDIYLDSLKHSDARLASTNLLLPPGDRAGLKQALLSADLVAAYGGAAAMENIRKDITSRQAFFAYGHRTSFSIFTRSVLTRQNVSRLAKKTALDIWLTDRRGCLSPAALFVQKGGVVSPLEFAGLVARVLSCYARPKKTSLVELLSRLRAAQGEIFRRVQGRSAELFNGGGWSVLYDEKMEYPMDEGPLVRVKAFSDWKTLEKTLRPLSGYFQCAAVEASSVEIKKILQKFRPLCLPRVCHAGRMQLPPLTWHHDGKPRLASWVSWTDWEGT